MPNSLFRRNVDAMSPYVPGEQPGAGSRVVKLNTNESPYPPSPQVAKAVAEAAEDLRLYPDPQAKALRDAAGRVLGFEREWVVAGNGSDELLAMLLRAFVEMDETVAYPVPTYSLYNTLVRAHGSQITEIPWPGDFTLPAELSSCGAKLVFIARPNAPTGTVVSLDSIRELATSLNGIVCVDEAYADFAEDNALELVRELPNVVVLRTMSKSYSLAGARVGIGVAQPEVVTGLEKVKDSYNISRVDLAAGAAAFNDGEWMKKNVERVKATRARLTAALDELGVKYQKSQANFVLAQFGPSARDIYLALKERGVLVRYWDDPMLADSVRISVGSDEEIDCLVRELGDILPKA